MFLKKIFFVTFLLLLSLANLLATESSLTEKKALFNPPNGWHLADSKNLPSLVKIMVVGKGQFEMPPSINLSYEKFEGSLQDYLKIIKQINQTTGDKWKNLGPIKIQAGLANLSEVFIKSNWGELQQMHVIFLEEGIVYILTASALKKEFSKFYNDFFKSFRSFRLE